jgi:serine/threonine protein kinase
LTLRPAPRATVDIRADVKQCPICERRFSGDAAFCPFDGVPLGSAAGDPKPDGLLGTVVDSRYRILEVLGEGGMGRVYKVNHLAIDRAFAMKVLRSDLACDEALSMRFLHEAKATASVKHPNVVQITDYGRQPDGTPYFVMELLVGQTLGQRLREGPLPVAFAIDVLSQVTKGAGAAHEAGIVHRDLKPDNVILVASRRSPSRDETLVSGAAPARPRERDRADVRVVDFGASKVVGASGFTRAGIVFGTPQYMSPEQASGAAVDARSDIYALGVIMYEMLTGRPPFVADSYMGVLTQHMFATPVPPSEAGMANADLGVVEGITLRCLEKKPEARFASMSELAAALEALAEGGGRTSSVMPRAKRSPAPDPSRRAPIAANGGAVVDRARPAFPSDGRVPRPAFASPSTPPRIPLLRVPVGGWLALAGAVLLGALGVLWPVLFPPARATNAVTPSFAAPSASSLDPVPSSTASTPAWPAPPAGSAAPVASASAPPPPSARPAASATHRAGRPRTTPPPAHGAPPLDDVGDPFAAHR